ncbi:hypothetical protein SAMN04488056_110109 [Cohaesibacter marisflavi]|uniref:Uncharacterized protein n=1 Tax=Cohaesibacter marisflavi TaxID=655353 RepID=A0A1I5J0H4_9HYPH|nr:hypothetical protein SAMN04488056_110109 [Cohaesibacter marisflavi]
MTGGSFWLFIPKMPGKGTLAGGINHIRQTHCQSVLRPVLHGPSAHVEVFAYRRNFCRYVSAVGKKLPT